MVLSLLGTAIVLIASSIQYRNGYNAGQIYGRTTTLLELMPTIEALESAQSSLPEIHEVVVRANQYPFVPTGVRVEAGDRISISLESPDQTWNCGYSGVVGPTGLGDDFDETGDGELLLEVGDYCGLVAQIGDGDRIPVGPSYCFIAAGSGVLYLGVNDFVPSHDSGSNEHYVDNDGELDLLVAITRAE